MKKAWTIMFAASTALMLTATGCEKDDLLKYIPKTKSTEATPTPVPVATATPTPAPTATPTPVPTATLAPRMIGVKNFGAKLIMLTNNVTNGIRDLYIKDSYSGSWGRNLIPSESMVRNGETVSMYYSEDPNGYQSGTFDIRIKTRNGATYDLYGIELDDMDAAVLSVNDYGTAILRYTSLSAGEERSTDTYYSPIYYGSGYSESYSDYDNYNTNYEEYYYDESYDSSYDEEYYG